MKFERGKNIKESLRVGKAANPIEIGGVYIESPFKGIEFIQHGYHLEEEVAKAVLLHCKHSIPELRTEVEIGDYNLFVIPIDKKGKEIIDKIRIKELKGEYVSYRGDLYPILFPIQVEMMHHRMNIDMTIKL